MDTPSPSLGLHTRDTRTEAVKRKRCPFSLSAAVTVTCTLWPFTSTPNITPQNGAKTGGKKRGDARTLTEGSYTSSGRSRCRQHYVDNAATRRRGAYMTPISTVTHENMANNDSGKAGNGRLKAASTQTRPGAGVGRCGWGRRAVFPAQFFRVSALTGGQKFVLGVGGPQLAAVHVNRRGQGGNER